MQLMTPGLYQERTAVRQAMERHKGSAADTELEPHVRHHAKTNAEMNARKIVELNEAIEENLAAIRQIQGTINALSISKHKTRDRSLVITKLEEAQDRLRRELGPEPTV